MRLRRVEGQKHRPISLGQKIHCSNLRNGALSRKSNFCLTIEKCFWDLLLIEAKFGRKYALESFRRDGSGQLYLFTGKYVTMEKPFGFFSQKMSVWVNKVNRISVSV